MPAYKDAPGCVNRSIVVPGEEENNKEDVVSQD